MIRYDVVGGVNLSFICSLAAVVRGEHKRQYHLINADLLDLEYVYTVVYLARIFLKRQVVGQ